MVSTAVLGGTGVLGSVTALVLRDAGHDVTLLSRKPPKATALQEFRHVPVDAASGDVAAALRGQDNLVLAWGTNELDAMPRPAVEYLRRDLIEGSARVAGAAAAAGVSRIVNFGSYFTAWDREHPGAGFARRHPYVQARIEQRQALIAAAPQAAVITLEIPYTFGSGPAGYPIWSDLILDRLVGPSPVVPYPVGGAPGTTLTQLGDATVRALAVGKPGGQYPIAQAHFTWTTMIRHLGAGLGLTRRAVPVPRFLAEPEATRMRKALERDGMDSGLNPRYLMRDLMYRHTTVDFITARARLGYADADLPAAMAESGRAYRRAHPLR